MESLNFPPVEFNRPDSEDQFCASGGTTAFPEFGIVLSNLHHFESIPTGKWLMLLQEKAAIRQKANRKEADRLHHLSEDLAANDEPDKAMIYITQALYRCPPEANLAKAILCQKGELLRRKERMQDAVRHLEQCLLIEGERFSFSTYRCLLRCYKAMGNGLKVRTTLARFATFFNRWKIEFQRYDSQLRNEPDAHMEEMKKEFDLHGDCIPKEIANDKNFRNEPTVQDNYEEDIHVEPYKGFSKDKYITGASSVCSLDENDSLSKIVANAHIPEGSVLVMERPLVSHLEFSKVQCYTCHVVHPHLIPCFTCHSVFYCSYQCQEKNDNFHKYECRGYQLLFFPLVNGNLELRMLILTLETLKRIANAKKTYHSPRTASELYKMLLEGREISAGLRNTLFVKLDYSGFRMEDYDALMIKTEKLLSYVKFDGLIKPSFFSQWKFFDDFQFSIFIGGLLLHFCTLTMTKVSRLSFNIQATEEFVGRLSGDFVPNSSPCDEETLRQVVLETLERYGKLASAAKQPPIDTDHLRKGVLVHLEALRSQYESNNNNDKNVKDSDTDFYDHVWTRRNVHKLWQRCLDQVNYETIQNQQLLPLVSHRREKDTDIVLQAVSLFFDSYFDFFGDVPRCRKDRTFPNTLRAFYPTISKLKHSCGPNLFVAAISNGLFVARARYTIAEGEELTLNHGPHFKEAPREERREYLKKIYIDCDCMECSRIEDHWIRHRRVKCEDCIFKANAPRPCPKCLQSKEMPWEIEILIQQLQNIESSLSKNHFPQLMHLSAPGRSGGGLQTATASGKRKIELLMFFERIWQMLFVDACNVPVYNNLKEQLSCFADEVIRDAIDEVYGILTRVRNIIDTLFPAMSVDVANEYELVVRRTVKYMLPAKQYSYRFLGVDVTQVERAIRLVRSMIKHAFAILEYHVLYDDDSFYKLTTVEDQFLSFEESVRRSKTQDEGSLFFAIIGAQNVVRDQSGAPRKDDQVQPRRIEGTYHLRDPKIAIDRLLNTAKQSDENQLVADMQRLGTKSKPLFARDVPRGDWSLRNDNNSTASTTNSSSSIDTIKTMGTTNVEDKEKPQDESGASGSDNRSHSKQDKNAKRKETGAIPKPNRTTKHHRKV